MQTLDTDGTYREDFFLGFPYDQVIPPLPTQFDYEGLVQTNAGLLTCPPGSFTLEYGRNTALNADAGLPYGGAPDSNDYYLRFPVLSWSGTAGLFLHVECTDTAVLSFDRSWSGYVGDIVSVVIDGMERMTFTGSAGYPWVRSSVLLGAGPHDIALVLNCAPYSTGTVRQGEAQSAAVVDLYRFLRITNLSLTNVAALPTADNQKLAMVAESTWTQVGPLLKATSGKLTLSAEATLLWPKKLSGALALTVGTTLSTGVGSFIGKYGQLSGVAEAMLSISCAVENDVQPEQLGFGLDGSASLVTESTLTPAATDFERPLLYSRLTMTRPVFVAGRPVNPVAVSETEIEYAIAGAVLSKINPVSPDNVLPVVPTLRWLSLGAHHDPSSGELQTWYDTTGAGASWTPGAAGIYAPGVGDYTIRNRISGLTRVNYPAVHFDAMTGDHLRATLPAPAGGFSFVFVGSFTRYRGALDDSCPLLDYTGGSVDYTAEQPIQRGVLPWAEANTAASVYLGLVPSNKQEPTVSKLAYAAADGYRSTDGVVISDNTPMVLVYSVSGANSFLMAAPLITGQNFAAGRMTTFIPTSTPGATGTFTLGKARRKPPAGGLFSTGSMNLLEVAYYNRALNTTEANAIGDFLTGLYSPVDIDAGPTRTSLGSGNVDTEQLMFYASSPEQPVAILSGSKSTVTDWYVSSPDSLLYIRSMVAAGVPLVQVSNRDYTDIIDAGSL